VFQVPRGQSVEARMNEADIDMIKLLIERGEPLELDGKDGAERA
jgi:hypothetical protein